MLISLNPKAIKKTPWSFLL